MLLPDVRGIGAEAAAPILQDWESKTFGRVVRGLIDRGHFDSDFAAGLRTIVEECNWRTWNDAVVRWLKEHAHKATAKEDVTKLRWLDQYLGGEDLEHIGRAVIDRITEAKLALGHRNATVNRTLELLRAILRKCVNDWEWLSRAPSVRMLKEPTRRIRFLTREEAQQLLAALPEHLADMRRSRLRLA